MPAWPHGDPRDVVRSIIADPRFVLHAATRESGRWWLDDIRDWVAQLLARTLHVLDHALGSRAPLDALIGWIVIAAAFGLAGYALYVLVQSYNMRARRRPDGTRRDAPQPGEHSAAALRAAALAAARAGRRGAAAALLFRAAVRALDERGRLAYDPARTPGEYRHILGDPQFDAVALDAVAALFAAAEPRADVFDRMIRIYDRMFELSTG